MTNLFRIVYYLSLANRRLRWNPDRLRKYQERRLRSVVKYAYDSVPFYNRLLKNVGIKPGDIKTLRDLNKLPVVRKDVLRQINPVDLKSERFDSAELSLLRTSGSTGKPFSFFISKKEGDWRKALYMRGNLACGQKPRDRWVVVTAPHHFSDSTSFQLKLGLFAQRCVSVFDPVGKQIRELSRLKPDVLDGYSGALLLLAQEVKRRELKMIKPRIIFGTADFIGNDSQRFVEDVFGAPFYDQFGCAEIDRAAWQCREKNGYHMDADSVIVQFVNEDGDEVSAGEKGEIVYTSLYSYAQPFIRYGISDLGERLDGECSCGIKLPLMNVLGGRKDSFLVLPDGRVVAPMSFWTMMRYFKYADYVEQFRVVQKTLGSLEVYVKHAEKLPFNEDFLRQSLFEHIVNCFGMNSPSALDLKVESVEEMPLDKSGKLRSVISLVSPDQHISKTRP